MTGTNVGDLLNAGHQLGLVPGRLHADQHHPSGSAGCGASHTDIGGVAVADYIPHHEPFQYYASTANPHHPPPCRVAEIGHGDQANHQYDLSFLEALDHRPPAGGLLPEGRRVPGRPRRQL